VSVHPSVRHLIFDLGGVILDLSIEQTLESFSRLSGIPKQKVQEIFQTSPGFNDYESGKMTDTGFRNYLRDIYRTDSSDQQLDACWNAMLGGIAMEKLHLLQRLKKSYSVYLLSNTNEIHLSYINSMILPKLTGERSLDSYFHKAYYSHRMQKRKPEVEIFEQVLLENQLKASETLFFDDNALNVEGAKLAGLQTVYVTSPDLILDYFHA
jgi:putative hydrolase of the HAD superfamily